MFGWITKLFAKRRMRNARLLFEFWDGRRFRSVDPWLAFRTLRDHPTFNVAEHYEFAAKGMHPDIDHFLDAMKAAFGVVPYDDRSGVGLTEPEMFDLLDDLTLQLDQLKKNGTTYFSASEPTASIGQSGTAESSPSETGQNSPSPPCGLEPESSSNAEPLSGPQ